MEDPRDYPSARDWYEDGANESTTEHEIDCVMWGDICARLNAKDAEVERLRGLIREFAGASNSLDAWLGGLEDMEPDVGPEVRRYDIAANALLAEAPAPAGREG